MNEVKLIGRVVRDPYVSKANPENPVAFFKVAVSDGVSKITGKEYVDFIEVKAWGNRALFCEKNIVKGRKILVTGKLRVDTKEIIDKTTDKKYYPLTVIALRIEPMDSREHFFKDDDNASVESTSSHESTDDAFPRKQKLPDIEIQNTNGVIDADAEYDEIFK